MDVIQLLIILLVGQATFVHVSPRWRKLQIQPSKFASVTLNVLRWFWLYSLALAVTASGASLLVASLLQPQATLGSVSSVFTPAMALCAGAYVGTLLLEWFMPLAYDHFEAKKVTKVSEGEAATDKPTE